MEILLEILERYGLPTALLVLVLWGAWRVVSGRDVVIARLQDEIKRLNEARIKESRDHSEKMVAAVRETGELLLESNRMIGALTTQIKAWRESR